MSFFKSCVIITVLEVFALFISYETSIVEMNCKCIPFYFCANGSINIIGNNNVIDIRMKSNECTSFMETCCDPKNNFLTSTTVPTAPPQKYGCGQRNLKETEGIPLEIAGNDNSESQFGEFPWMIAIFHRKTGTLKHIYKCGGSLIHPKVVLTAAHCVVDDGSYKIRAGEWDSRTTNETYPHQDRNVKSIEIHHRYDSRNLQYDIALLFLASPVETAFHISMVCLHPTGSIALSKKCFVNGWGKEWYDKKEVTQAILKKIELPIISRYDCEGAFRNTRLGKRFYLHNSFICAGGGKGKDACIGDGGGALVCPIAGTKGRYQQVGIVSWGIGCGTQDVPGAYASVGRLRTWIDQQMTKKHFNISCYQYGI